jgi:NAD(P)-dependent dehydrogenase (short-subunit alcohol dehydrogenase family)
MREYRDRVAVVTGAASGIGAALAERLAAEGAKVVVVDRDDAQPTVDRITAAGGTAIAARCDVASQEAMNALARDVYDRFGRCDLLCNNAGVVLFSSLMETKESDWQWLISVNILGPIHGVNAFVPRMLEQGGDPAQILNTASGAGLIATGPLPTGAYATTKFAVVGYSEGLRAELAPHGISLSILCPGSVHTAILDTARYGEQAKQWKPAEVGAPTPTREHVRRMEPADVANLVLAGLKNEAPIIVTHPEMRPGLEARFAEQMAACESATAQLGL